jgi:hypothetical protein
MAVYGPRPPYSSQPQSISQQFGAQPPVPPPMRRVRGRFWLGVLTGGCAVLVLEAIVILVAAVLIGSAIHAAVTSAGPGLAGLPNVPLPSGLPQLNAKSDACAPPPCLAHGGVTVLVSNVTRNAGTQSGGGSDVVQLDVTFVGTSGTHTVAPGEIALRDSAGNLVLSTAEPSVTGCEGEASPQEIGSGERIGPVRTCFVISGQSTGPLSVVWIDAEDFAILELRLP